MIGLIIWGFIFVCAFYAWWPDYMWALYPSFAVFAVLRFLIKKSLSKHPGLFDKLDEFDWWQDNQGL